MEKKIMTSISVYEPVGCCSSGVCGPEVEDSMAGFAAALSWAKKQGVAVSVYNLGHQPGAFAENADVKNAIENEGLDCLPLVIADEKIISKGVYLSKSALAEKVGLNFKETQDEAKENNTNQSCCG